MVNLSGGSYRAKKVSLGSCSIVLQDVESASLELYGYFSTAWRLHPSVLRTILFWEPGPF